MNENNNVYPIIEGTVYTVPSYTNKDNEKIRGNNITIKLYHKDLIYPNSGIKPLDLLKIIMDHYGSKQMSSADEEVLMGALSHAYDAVQKEEEENG